MASGKSTVAEMLAQRLGMPSVHLRGDVFRQMVVAGRHEMTPDPTGEALRQLELRYRLTACAAEAYHVAGFAVVVQDIYLGDWLKFMVESIRGRPLFVVVLAPRAEVVAAREAARPKKGYGGGWTVQALDAVLRNQTPRIGLWLDNSDETPEQTVARILARHAAEAIVQFPGCRE